MMSPAITVNATGSQYSVLTRIIRFLDKPEVFRVVIFSVVMLLMLLLATDVLAATAGSGDDDSTWTSLMGTIKGWFTGDAAIIVSLLSLAAGVMGAIASSHKAISVAMAISIPLAINVGPTIFIGLSGAVC